MTQHALDYSLVSALHFLGHTLIHSPHAGDPLNPRGLDSPGPGSSWPCSNFLFKKKKSFFWFPFEFLFTLDQPLSAPSVHNPLVCSKHL